MNWTLRFFELDAKLPGAIWLWTCTLASSPAADDRAGLQPRKRDERAKTLLGRFGVSSAKGPSRPRLSEAHSPRRALIIRDGSGKDNRGGEP